MIKKVDFIKKQDGPSGSKLESRGDLYFPSKDFKEKAVVNKEKIYKDAAKNPLKFWEKLAGELFWRKRWMKTFEHNPPFFKWFSGGKINITENCLDKNLERNKDKVAFIWEPEPLTEIKKELTFGQLFKEVCKLSNALKSLGVKKGDRVCIYLPMIPEIIISMLACARIGAVHAVVFSAFSPTALNARLQDTGAEILITADGYFRRGKVVSLKSNADQAIKETKVKKVVVVKRLEQLLGQIAEKQINELDWSAARDIWFDDLVKDQKDFCEPEIMDAEDPLFILYTSGSTGKPKGILHTCGGYCVQARFTAKWIFDLKSDDIFWSTADIGWITGHTYSCYGPLLNGTAFVIFEGAPDWPNPDRWCQILEKYKITTFYTAPTAIRMFEKYGTNALKGRHFEFLQILGSVGEPIDEQAWQWYFKEIGRENCPIVDTWWQTETGGILITSLPGLGPFKPSFTGIPFPGVKFDILDEDGKSCPAGQSGSLVILPPFAPGMVRGIYNNPEKYKETYWSAFGPDVYFTSDAAFKDENGLIRIVGRLDDVIKVAGHRITTGEVENAVNKLSEITECAAIGLPDEIKGEALVVFAVFKGENQESELKEKIVSQVRKEIGPIALPKEIYLVGDLPKTRSGKIMRRILRKLIMGEDLGDLSTLANPESVERIKNLIA